MPWKKFKVEGGWKNWKVDAQGKKVGGPLSKKPMTEEEADTQTRALYVSEKKPKKEMNATDSEGEVTNVEQVTFTGLDEAITAGHEKDYYEPEMAMMPMGGACSWEEMDAMEDAEEMQAKMYGLTDKMGMMAHNAMKNPMIEDKAQALTNIAKGFVNRIKKPDDEKSNEAIAKQIAGENQTAPKDTDQQQPGGDSDDQTTTKTQDLFIWKEGEVYRWLAAYSNNRRDNDNPPEIITTESHKELQ